MVNTIPTLCHTLITRRVKSTHPLQAFSRAWSSSDTAHWQNSSSSTSSADGGHVLERHILLLCVVPLPGVEKALLICLTSAFPRWSRWVSFSPSSAMVGKASFPDFAPNRIGCPSTRSFCEEKIMLSIGGLDVTGVGGIRTGCLHKWRGLSTILRLLLERTSTLQYIKKKKKLTYFFKPKKKKKKIKIMSTLEIFSLLSTGLLRLHQHHLHHHRVNQVHQRVSSASDALSGRRSPQFGHKHARGLRGDTESRGGKKKITGIP